MAARKRIGLLLLFPENIYQQRIMKGIFSQCEKYDYDVVVVSPQAQVTNFYKDYLNGELNVFEYVNFDLLDGVIVAPLTMNEDRITTVCDYLLDKLKKECTKPVVSIDYQFGDYPVAYTDDRTAFYYITRHCLRTHHCRRVMMLAGPQDYSVSVNRIGGVRDALREEGLELTEDDIFYGDFWYSGGENLGKKLAESPENLPEAVICASDHMAIGLTNYLMSHGIKVPEQVIVTGYEATQDALMNTPSVTSYAADEIKTGALAVNILHNKIDPMEPDIELMTAGVKNLCIGGSCGCSEDVHYAKNRMSSNVFKLDHNYNDPGIWNRTDISMLLESYMAEILTATRNANECICKIYESTYLLKPYGIFYLCLNENWLDTDNEMIDGYTDRMQMVLYSDMNKKLHGFTNHVFVEKWNRVLFDRKQMIPELSVSSVDIPDCPQVYYVVPVHFNTVSLGVAILQNNLSQANMIGTVYRNYIRNINNGLEMTRNREKIIQLSEHDMMTGLLNRRGMNNAIEKMKHQAEHHPSEVQNLQWLVYVIDLDGLKRINDTYGHYVGDNAIIAISGFANEIARDTEICVRGGGDEFFIIGLGNYDEESERERTEHFKTLLKEQEPFDSDGTRFSASIGWKLGRYVETDVVEVLKQADAKMYDNKRSRNEARID